MTYYMVFERPVGSKCWTVATVNGIPKYGTDNAKIQAWAEIEYTLRVTPMEWHIATVEVPA